MPEMAIRENQILDEACSYTALKDKPTSYFILLSKSNLTCELQRRNKAY